LSDDKIYQHFHVDERRFIDRCLDWIDQVEQSYSVISTYFLNPREIEILQSLVGKRELQVFSSQDLLRDQETGALLPIELSKVILAPEFYVLDEADFDLALLEINYAAKFVQLSHAQVLGTFLGQTGIKRQELGDIMMLEDKIQVFVSRHLVEIFKDIKKIGASSVRMKEIPLSEFEKAADKAVSEIILVDSLRIDKIIAIAFKISRNLATNMLESNKIKLNYLETNKKDSLLVPGDLISIRGFGRIKIGQILGLTKKGKQRVEIEFIKNRKK
jgi:RNA-binding protein YlmH